MFILEEEILFKPEGENYREKRLLGGMLKMLNLPCKLRHKVSLILDSKILNVAEDLQPIKSGLFDVSVYTLC